jgi:L-cysteine S-thiosulfotransferase
MRHPTTRYGTAAALATVLASLAGCAGDARSGHGFRLPDGDAEAGRRAFVELRCHVCHTAPGVDAKFEGTPATDVPLGGPVTRVQSYGELVTAIINPSHRIVLKVPQAPASPSEPSPMEFARLNDHLTVQQLIDLVAFLQSTYQVVAPTYNPYAYTYP